MQAVCSLCKQMLRGREDLVLDENREARQFMALGQAVMEHVHTFHREDFNRAVMMGKTLEGYLLMQMTTCIEPGFDAGMAGARQLLETCLQGALPADPLGLT